MYLNTADKHADVDVSDNFRYCTNTTASWRGIRGVLAKAPDTGLHYFEAVNHLADYGMVGIGDDGASLTTTADSSNATSLWNRLRKVRQNGASIPPDQDAVPVGAIIGVLYDSDASTVEFFVDGVSVASPTSVVVDTYFPIASVQLNAAFTFRFSESQMTHRPESAQAWVTDSLADRITQLAPAAYYKLDETEGATATDSSGNDNHGTISGGVTLGADPLAWSDDTSKSMTFDGTDGAVDLGAFGANLHGVSAISAAFLIRLSEYPASTAEPIIYIPINGASSGFYVAVESDGGLHVGGRSQSGDSYQSDTTAAGTLSLDRTYIGVATLDFVDDAIRIDLNGERISDTAATFGASTYTHGSPSVNATLFAAPDSSLWLSATGDGIAFFGVALTAADAFALAERVVQKTYRGTVLAMGADALWPVDETTGTIAEDVTGNGNDGTYVSATLAQPPLIAEPDGHSVSLPEADGAHITIPQLADGKTVFAFGCWIDDWSLSTGDKSFLVSFRSSTRLVFLRLVSGPQVEVFVKQGNSSDISVSASIVETGPAFVMGIWDDSDGQMSVYFDSDFVASTGFSGFNAPSATHAAIIGANPDGDFNLNGAMDVPAFFGFAPTPAQISALYYRGTTAAVTPLSLDGTAMKAGAPVARLIRAHLQADGSLIGETTSSAADGSWSIPIDTEEPMYVVAHGEGEESDLVAGDIYAE